MVKGVEMFGAFLDHAVALPPEAEAVRGVVRRFVDLERAAGRLLPPQEISLGFDREMSRRIGRAGLIGLTWPKRYGGHERSALERYVATEELLAAPVPVGMHWIADRQSGPVLLKFGSESQRDRYLPPITRGESCFCVGMSEPDSGSDLASLRSKAERVGEKWQINGRKVWTSNAHRSDFMLVLVRTSAVAVGARHAGLSQFIVDLTLPGITIRPIINIAGGHEFNEVILDDVIVDEDALIGIEGNGWAQISAELAYERSGPERWLSSFRLLQALVALFGDEADETTQEAIGGLIGQMIALRRMSIGVAVKLETGASPNLESAIVKDLGTRFEQDLVRTVRDIYARIGPALSGDSARFERLMANAQMWSPAFTIRGGTAEILRGIIAKGLDLR